MLISVWKVSLQHCMEIQICKYLFELSVSFITGKYYVFCSQLKIYC